MRQPVYAIISNYNRNNSIIHPKGQIDTSFSLTVKMSEDRKATFDASDGRYFSPLSKSN